MRGCTSEINRFSRSFPSHVRTPAAARRFCVDVLRRCGLDRLGEVAELLVSELVTNAVVHAAPPVHVRLACSELGARIAVTDGSVVRPVLATPDATSESGRGVYLVDLLAARWGVDGHTGGKTVWFELD